MPIPDKGISTLQHAKGRQRLDPGVGHRQSGLGDGEERVDPPAPRDAVESRPRTLDAGPQSAFDIKAFKPMTAVLEATVDRRVPAARVQPSGPVHHSTRRSFGDKCKGPVASLNELATIGHDHSGRDRGRTGSEVGHFIGERTVTFVPDG